MAPEERALPKILGPQNSKAAVNFPAKDIPVSNSIKTKEISLATDTKNPKIHFPPAVKDKSEEKEEIDFVPNVGKFFSDFYEGLKKAAGYIPHIPESIIYVVGLNIPSLARAVISPAVIVARSIAGISSSEKFDFSKILIEEKEAILMVEPKSRWINGVREFFNEHIPGGSLFKDDETFANTSDQKLKEIVNPLTNISKVIVDPLTTPLHDVAQGLTDRVTYSIYIHFSENKSLGYPEFLKEVEDEKNWQLRMGRSAICAVETLAIAYYCGGAGAKTKQEALFRTAEFLKMPFFMTGLQAVATILKREDFSKLTIEQMVVEALIQIPQGMFDSASFMLPISKLSQWNINRGINKLNNQMLASSTSAKLPTPSISQYQADVNKLMLRTQIWGEMYDFAEGMPDAQTKGIELKDRIIELALNPSSIYKNNWKQSRLAGATALEFTSAALDLVDGKKGHKKSLHAVSENAQSEVDKTLKGNTYELEGGVEEVQQYFCDYHYRKLAIEGVESVLTYFGITALSNKDQLRKEIEKRSKSVYAFYDGERDVIFAPKLPDNASTAQKLVRQSYLEHEEFHRRVALHPQGLEGVLREEPIVRSFIEQIILTKLQAEEVNQEQSIDSLLQTPEGRKRLEEYAATSYQVLSLEQQGISKYTSSLINSCLNQGVLDFVAGIFAANDPSLVKQGGELNVAGYDIFEDLDNDTVVVGNGVLGDKSQELSNFCNLLKNSALDLNEFKFRVPRSVTLTSEVIENILVKLGFGTSMEDAIKRDANTDKIVYEKVLEYLSNPQVNERIILEYILKKYFADKNEYPYLISRSSGAGDAIGKGAFLSKELVNDLDSFVDSIAEVIASIFSLKGKMSLRKEGFSFAVLVQPLVGQSIAVDLEETQRYSRSAIISELESGPVFGPLLSGHGYANDEGNFMSVIVFGQGGGVVSTDPMNWIDFERVSSQIRNSAPIFQSASMHLAPLVPPNQVNYCYFGLFMQKKTGNMNVSIPKELLKRMDITQLSNALLSLYTTIPKLGANKYYEWALRLSKEGNPEIIILQVANTKEIKPHHIPEIIRGTAFIKARIDVIGCGRKEVDEIIFCRGITDLEKFANYRKVEATKTKVMIIFDSSIIFDREVNYERAAKCEQLLIAIRPEVILEFPNLEKRHEGNASSHFSGLLEEQDILFAMMDIPRSITGRALNIVEFAVTHGADSTPGPHGCYMFRPKGVSKKLVVHSNMDAQRLSRRLSQKRITGNSGYSQNLGRLYVSEEPFELIERIDQDTGLSYFKSSSNYRVRTLYFANGHVIIVGKGSVTQHTKNLLSLNNALNDQKNTLIKVPRTAVFTEAMIERLFQDVGLGASIRRCLSDSSLTVEIVREKIINYCADSENSPKFFNIIRYYLSEFSGKEPDSRFYSLTLLFDGNTCFAASNITDSDDKNLAKAFSNTIANLFDPRHRTKIKEDYSLSINLVLQNAPSQMLSLDPSVLPHHGLSSLIAPYCFSSLAAGKIFVNNNGKASLYVMRGNPITYHTPQSSLKWISDVELVDTNGDVFESKLSEIGTYGPRKGSMTILDADGTLFQSEIPLDEIKDQLPLDANILRELILFLEKKGNNRCYDFSIVLDTLGQPIIYLHNIYENRTNQNNVQYIPEEIISSSIITASSDIIGNGVKECKQIVFCDSLPSLVSFERDMVRDKVDPNSLVLIIDSSLLHGRTSARNRETDQAITRIKPGVLIEFTNPLKPHEGNTSIHTTNFLDDINLDVFFGVIPCVGVQNTESATIQDLISSSGAEIDALGNYYSLRPKGGKSKFIVWCKMEPKRTLMRFVYPLQMPLTENYPSQGLICITEG